MNRFHWHFHAVFNGTGNSDSLGINFALYSSTSKLSESILLSKSTVYVLVMMNPHS